MYLNYKVAWFFIPICTKLPAERELLGKWDCLKIFIGDILYRVYSTYFVLCQIVYFTIFAVISNCLWFSIRNSEITSEFLFFSEYYDCVLLKKIEYRYRIIFIRLSFLSRVCLVNLLANPASMKFEFSLAVIIFTCMYKLSSVRFDRKNISPSRRLAR